MGVFTEKSGVSGTNSLILNSDGEYEDISNAYVEALGDSLEYIGYRTVNGIYYRIYRLKPPPTIEETGI